jgi:ribosomal protein S18 acetylase RimI-like enzyme
LQTLLVQLKETKKKGSTMPTNGTLHDAFIDELYIVPAHRRRGLGRQAMTFVERQAHEMGVNAIHLEVDRGNDSALELYRRTGYVDHDRLLMTKWMMRDTK